MAGRSRTSRVSKRAQQTAKRWVKNRAVNKVENDLGYRGTEWRARLLVAVLVLACAVLALYLGVPGVPVAALLAAPLMTSLPHPFVREWGSEAMTVSYRLLVSLPMGRIPGTPGGRAWLLAELGFGKPATPQEPVAEDGRFWPAVRLDSAMSLAGSLALTALSVGAVAWQWLPAIALAAFFYGQCASLVWRRGTYPRDFMGNPSPDPWRIAPCWEGDQAADVWREKFTHVVFTVLAGAGAVAGLSFWVGGVLPLYLAAAPFGVLMGLRAFTKAYYPAYAAERMEKAAEIERWNSTWMGLMGPRTPAPMYAGSFVLPLDDPRAAEQAPKTHQMVLFQIPQTGSFDAYAKKAPELRAVVGQEYVSLAPSPKVGPDNRPIAGSVDPQSFSIIYPLVTPESETPFLDKDIGVQSRSLYLTAAFQSLFLTAKLGRPELTGVRRLGGQAVARPRPTRPAATLRRPVDPDGVSIPDPFAQERPLRRPVRPEPLEAADLAGEATDGLGARRTHRTDESAATGEVGRPRRPVRPRPDGSAGRPFGARTKEPGVLIETVWRLPKDVLVTPAQIVAFRERLQVALRVPYLVIGQRRDAAGELLPELILVLGCKPAAAGALGEKDLMFLAALRWDTTFRAAQVTSGGDRDGATPYLLSTTTSPVGLEQLVFSLPPGLTVESVRGARAKLADAIKAGYLEIPPSPRAGEVTVVTGDEDPLANELEDPWPLLDAVPGSLEATDPIPFGINDSGEVISAPLFEKHWLVAGMSGGGKSVTAQQLLCGAALMKNTRLIMLDPKRVEIATWVRSGRIAQHAYTDIDEATAVLNDLLAEMRRRYDHMDDHGLRKLEPSPEWPLILLYIDELAGYSAAGKESVEFNAALRVIIAQARASGISVIAATQKPSAELLPTSIRDNFSQALALRCKTPSHSDVILGMGNSAVGLDASRIQAGKPGLGYVLGDACPEGGRFRSYYLKDDQIEEIANRTAAVLGKGPGIGAGDRPETPKMPSIPGHLSFDDD